MTVLSGALLDADPGNAVPALCSSVFSRPFLRMPGLAALRAHDDAHGSEYVATLTACLDALGNVSTAAGRLGVHVNTYRYRVRRLVALSGIDLNDADVRLVCGLELAAPAVADEPGLAGVPVTVVAFRILDGSAEASCRLARMVALSWDAFRTSAWCDVTGHTVYSAVTVESSEIVSSTVRRVVHDAHRALSAGIVAGIGPTRLLADDVLRIVLERRSAGPVASLDDVRTSVVLDAFAAAASEWPDIDGGVVSRLAAHDAAHRTSYVESLRAYLRSFGDVAAAAAQVFVHVRTFRYRLRRIEALCGVRLDDPATRLAVALELRVR